MDEHYISFELEDEKKNKITSHIRVYHPNAKKTLLALHGMASTAKESFNDFAHHIPDYKIVAPDWIGYGRTSKPLDKNAKYDLGYCTSWLNRFIDCSQKEGILEDKFSIYGISMAALGITESYQDNHKNIEKIIFQNPAGLDKKINKKFALGFGRWGLLNIGILKILSTNSFLWNSTLNDFSEEKRKRLKEDLKNDGGEGFEVMLRQGKSGFNIFGNMNKKHYVPEKFARIDNPILLLYGEKDSLFYKQEYIKFAKEHNWQIKKIENGKHTFHTEEEWKQASEAVKKFLEG